MPVTTFNTVIHEVNELLQKGFELPAEKLTPDAMLGADLGLDSLDAVDMLVHIEEKLGVKVEGEKLQELKTLQDVYSLVSASYAKRTANSSEAQA